jgi:hypothetical protein
MQTRLWWVWQSLHLARVWSQVVGFVLVRLAWLCELYKPRQEELWQKAKKEVI